MAKVTLDMNTFKALASDTRLDILRVLDGKRMSLKDISKATKLNKATLHEHLAKLHEAGLVKKKEREGHKWVYYKLTWKGEGLLHPENTRIVVMFSVTFISLFLAVMLIVSFLQPITVGMAETVGETTYLYEAEDEGIPLLTRSYNFNYVAEINATGQRVRDITVELQKKSKPRNLIGDEYADDDIQWKTLDNKGIGASQIMLFSTYCIDYRNDTINETEKWKEGNNADNNTPTAPGETKGDGGYFEYYPAVPEMIATAQDRTLLYFAIVCITFFGVSFTLSTWRLWKNKKPKL